MKSEYYKRTYNIKENMSFFDENKIRKLLNNYDILKFNEFEKNETNLFGQTKHWHIYEVIAKKI